ncbi:MAG: DUF2933 domain-containing protein [Roseiflexaceae bacterium]
MQSQHSSPAGGAIAFLRSRAGITLIAFLAIATFYLVTEHTAHFFGVLPFALLLLCPILHLFMHGGHGGQNDQREPGDHSQHQTQPTEGDRR